MFTIDWLVNMSNIHSGIRSGSNDLISVDVECCGSTGTMSSISGVSVVDGSPIGGTSTATHNTMSPSN